MPSPKQPPSAGRRWCWSAVRRRFLRRGEWKWFPVETAEEMAKHMSTRLSWSTVVVMAAAVADFRPKHAAELKLKKRGKPITHP